MLTALKAGDFEQAFPLLSEEWIRSSLILALISVWVVIALFAYLNHSTKKPYFSLWTVAWMFYAVYLAASLGLEESPDTPFLVMARRACVGISALFMFWGSFELANCGRNRLELGLATVMMLVWSYLAAYKVRETLWITIPVFALLAAASAYTGVLYFLRRRRYRGATILGTGFVLWSFHLLAVPLTGNSNALRTVVYFASSILALMISVGMVVEQEVNVSEHDYRALFDSAGDAILLLNSATLRVMEANVIAQRLTGRTADGLAGCQFADLCPALCATGEPALDARALAEVINKPCAEFHIARAGGGPVVCEGRASLVHCPKGMLLQINVRDITERKRLEDFLRESTRRLEATLTELRRTQKQVVQQERLGALSKMASGVAHDFNNVLAKIVGFDELLLAWPDSLDDKEKVKKYLQMIDATAKDAVEIVNRLREFYRPREDSEVYLSMDPNDLVRQALALTQPRWKGQAMAGGVTIHLQTELPDVPFVRGDPAELRDAFMNLIVNAADAMPDGGTIRVSSRLETDDVVFEVADTGTGMTEEVRQQCFEPFFTTKGEQASGLGLAIVHGTIRRHGGKIEVQSEVGRGTSFIIHLPAVKEQQVQHRPPASNGVQPLRVLVVEDDAQFRDIEAEYLRGDGHSVETATNGREGLQKFQSERFDLVVADHAMPEMNGEQMTKAIKSASPNTPVIIVTGFRDVIKNDGPDPARPDVVLAKPITAVLLRQAVARVVTARAAVASAIGFK
jgi:PAS domain S-box-containing protein